MIRVLDSKKRFAEVCFYTDVGIHLVLPNLDGSTTTKPKRHTNVERNEKVGGRKVTTRTTSSKWWRWCGWPTRRRRSSFRAGRSSDRRRASCASTTRSTSSREVTTATPMPTTTTTSSWNRRCGTRRRRHRPTRCGIRNGSGPEARRLRLSIGPGTRRPWSWCTLSTRPSTKWCRPELAMKSQCNRNPMARSFVRICLHRSGPDCT